MTSIINNLPKDRTLKILSYLDADDLVKCSSVCSKWRKLSGENCLWENLFPDRIALLETASSPDTGFCPSTIALLIPRQTSVKDSILNENGVLSKRHLMHRIREFTQQVQPGRKGALICHYFINERAKVMIAGLGLNNQPIHLSICDSEDRPNLGETDLFEPAVFMKRLNGEWLDQRDIEQVERILTKRVNEHQEDVSLQETKRQCMLRLAGVAFAVSLYGWITYFSDTSEQE